MIDFLAASGAERRDFYERNAAELSNRQFQQRRELEELRTVLATGEHLLSIAVGDFADKKHLVVLTDRRLILLHKGVLGGLKQRSIDLGHIVRLEAEKGLMSGQISFGDGSEISRLKSVPRKSVDPFMAKLRAAIDAAKRGVSLASAKTGLPQSMSSSAAPAAPTPLTAGSKRLLRPLLATTALAALIAGVVMTDTSDADSNLPAPPPPVTADAPGVSAPPQSLSTGARRFEELYRELQKFREEQRFLSVGFTPGGPYYGWMQRTKRLDNQQGRNLLSETGVIPGDLVQLGLLYVRGERAPADAVARLEGRFRLAFDPPARGPGRGVLVSDSQACGEFDVVRRSWEALATGDVSESNEILDSGSCDLVLPGTVVGAPSATRTVGGGDATASYVYVRPADGAPIWIYDDAVDYSPAR